MEHKTLSEGRWAEMPLCEQMANIGSEVIRAIKWKKKCNDEYSSNSVSRALELLDLSLDSLSSFPSLKEVARLREAVTDYFYGENTFKSSENSWTRYFNYFNYMARRDI